jgi:dienelactone hydrolase
MTMIHILRCVLVFALAQSISAADEPPWTGIARYFDAPEKFTDDFASYRSPLDFYDGRHVKTPQDWQERKREIRERWMSLLGPWPTLITHPKVKELDRKRRGDLTQIRVRFDWVPGQSTEGYLLIPDGKGKRPAVITVFYEPETAIGKGKAFRDFGIQLARRGFVVLSLGSTKATAAQTYGLYHPSIEDAQVQPLSMLGYAAVTGWHLLADRDEVDDKRIGIVGHSFGGKWAMFASCLFDRFAAAAWSDPGIVFDDQRPSINYWEPWYLGYHPKPWRPRGLISEQNPAKGVYVRLRQEGYDLHELHALMAPRPFLVSGGSEDPPRRWQALNHTIAVNRLLGFHHRVGMTNRPDHSPNAQSNEVIYKFFEHFLR